MTTMVTWRAHERPALKFSRSFVASISQRVCDVHAEKEEFDQTFTYKSSMFPSDLHTLHHALHTTPPWKVYWHFCKTNS